MKPLKLRLYVCLLIGFTPLINTDVLAHKYIIKRNGDFELFQETKDTYHVIYDTSKVDSIKVPVRILAMSKKHVGNENNISIN